MPSDYHHGIRVIEVPYGTRFPRTIPTSIIGGVFTANDADPKTFPLNKPVLGFGTRDWLDKAGETGTLALSLDAIKDQCEPLIMAVRVEESDDVNQTISNIIGGRKDGKYTGLQALLSCKQNFGYKPRILGVPGWDTNIAIAKELGIIAEKLKAFAYVGVKAETEAEVVTYRKNFGNARIMLIWPDFLGWDTISNSEKTLYASARALGLRSKIDNEIGWHKTISNINVNGVSGLSKDIYWEIQSSDTVANYLNSHDVTTLINEDGFKFWGSRTCSDDPQYSFENYRRTMDIVGETNVYSHLWAIDKPISEPLVRDILDGINAKFRDWTQNHYILGGEAWFDHKYNPKEAIKEGKLVIDYAATPVPPLENLTFRQQITDKFIINLIDSLK